MYCHFSSIPNHRVKGLFHHCLLTVCRSGFTHSMARGQGLWGGSRFHHSLCSLGLHPTGQTGESNEMAAARISTEEGRSTRQYHSDSSIPTEASAKVILTGPKSEPEASKWLGLHSRKSGGDFPDWNAGAWNHISQLFLFWLVVCTSAAFLMCYSE